MRAPLRCPICQRKYQSVVEAPIPGVLLFEHVDSRVCLYPTDLLEYEQKEQM